MNQKKSVLRANSQIGQTGPKHFNFPSESGGMITGSTIPAHNKKKYMVRCLFRNGCAPDFFSQPSDWNFLSIGLEFLKHRIEFPD